MNAHWGEGQGIKIQFPEDVQERVTMTHIRGGTQPYKDPKRSAVTELPITVKHNHFQREIS